MYVYIYIYIHIYLIYLQCACATWGRHKDLVALKDMFAMTRRHIPCCNAAAGAPLLCWGISWCCWGATMVARCGKPRGARVGINSRSQWM